MGKKTEQLSLYLTSFDEGFLEDYAGSLITNPEVALVELVANSWDAGATKVEIKWPSEIGGDFEILDNGTGMSKEKFLKIWPKLNYNRVKNEGSVVKFPEKNMNINRPAYGRNGKGRHSLFCFSDDYIIETWQKSQSIIFQVRKTTGNTIFEFNPIKEYEKEGNGTKLSCQLINSYIEETLIKEILGSKFITDPNFNIYINGDKVDLINLDEDIGIHEIQIPDEKEIVTIYHIVSKSGRLSRQHGVAWWVNNRLVGKHSWDGYEGAYLDGRTKEAHEHTFIINADILKNEVEADWSGFKKTSRAKKIIEFIEPKVFSLIRELMKKSRKEVKLSVLSENKENVEKLSQLSKEKLGKYVDDLQERCPRMTNKDLSNAIDVFTQLELSRSGYGLLQQLVSFSPDQFDELQDVLEKWSITEAKVVLDELYNRLELINKIETLSADPTADELHELHPLIEKGLWIFGPEYEGVKYFSNRRILTILREHFNKKLKQKEVKSPLKRPDFVVFPDSSISSHESNSFDDRGEVSGTAKIIIIELKKGGSRITLKESTQAYEYAEILQKSGQIDKSTEITCFVIGNKVDVTGWSSQDKKIIINPRPFNTIIKQANARTFYLIEKLKEVKGVEYIEDEEIKELFKQKNLAFFQESH